MNKRHSNRPWYLPIVCALAFIDLFVLFIPTEGMIVTTSVMRPRRWLPTSIAVTLSSTLGALTMAYLTRIYGEQFVGWIAGNELLQSSIWAKTETWIAQYGFWGIWFIALGPLPQQPAILISALAHMDPNSIALAVFLGRLPKYVGFSYLATKGEQWIREEFAEHESLNHLPGLKNALLKLVHDPAADIPDDSNEKPKRPE
jgi:membrane protein YqaA with SNARE-associated domain